MCGGNKTWGGDKMSGAEQDVGEGEQGGSPPPCDPFATPLRLLCPPPPFPGCSVCCKSTWAQLRDICRSEGLRCAALDVTRRNLGEFEVEYLCDYKRVAVSSGAALGGGRGGLWGGGGSGMPGAALRCPVWSLDGAWRWRDAVKPKATPPSVPVGNRGAQSSGPPSRMS